MKKMRWARGILLCLAAALSLLAAGCNKKEKTEEAVKKEFYYLPEYQELKLTSDYINSYVQSGDDLVMIGTTWSENGNSYRLIHYHLLNGTTDETTIDVVSDESEYFSQVSSDAEGNLVVLLSSYGENGEPSQSLKRISATDGNVIEEISIDGLSKELENGGIYKMVLDQENQIYLTYSSENNDGILVLTKDGKLKKKIDSGNGWINDIFVANDGFVYVLTYDDGMVIKKVDVNAGSLSGSIKTDTFMSLTGSQTFFGSVEDGVMVNTGEGLSSYDFKTNQVVSYLDWLDSDINSESVKYAGSLSDGRLFAYLEEYNEGAEAQNYSVVLLTKTPASEVPEKEEVILGTLYLSQDARRKVIDFNKKSTEYHVSVKTYGNFTDLDSYNESITKFNNSLTSGNGPDIIDITNVDYAQYASKGLFEDLYPYMEKNGIKKENYLDNILEALEVDGKLCAILPQFYINSTAVKSSKVPGKTGWTLSEFLDFVESNEAENVFQYSNRESIFYYCIYNNIDEFMNWETGESYFDTENFERVLEFANKFPEEIDYETTQEEGTSAKLRSDKLLLVESSIDSVQTYQMYCGLFGEPVTFIGYPNKDRNGNNISSYSSGYAISSKSKSKDAAFQFLSVFLSDEYQDGLVRPNGGGGGFPISKKALDKMFQRDMTPEYQEDENGNQVEAPKTSWGYDDFDMDIYAAKQSEIDEVKKIITSITRFGSSNVNEELMNILKEETAPFFKGQKSAKEIAGIIQNRVQIYMKEHS